MFKKVLIIGCGLIGSSILRAINSKKLSKKTFVLEKSKKNISKIKKIKSNCKFIKSINREISDVDLVIICTPMSQYKKIIQRLNKSLKAGCLITDVGSTKQNIIKLKNKILNKKLYWILSHPIAGSEVSGPEYGNKNLFLNKWCVIIKEKKQNSKKINLLKKFWKKIGSKVVLMNPVNHDKIFSITSHLPHLIAYNLIKTAQDSQKIQRKNLIQYSAGGLRDFSRIAASNEIMWRDIFFNNDNIIKAINLFTKNLNSFKKIIQNKNNKKLLSRLSNSKKVRTQIVQLKQDIAKPDFGRE
jgi:prephenate dehydrogenase/cyclohexadieny/prephenate dehydrogenase